MDSSRRPYLRPRHRCRRAWDAEYIACGMIAMEIASWIVMGHRGIGQHWTVSSGDVNGHIAVGWAPMRSVGSWDASPMDGTAGRQGTRCAFDIHSSFRLYENNDVADYLFNFFTWIIRFILLWCF